MPPSHDSDLIARVVDVDGFAVVEVWDPVGKSWKPGRPALLASIPKWPPALPHVLERLGVPRSDWDERLK
jgi:hypothetical protein